MFRETNQSSKSKKMGLSQLTGNTSISVIVILLKSLCLVKIDNFSNFDEGIYECRSEKLGLPQLTSSLSVTVIDPTKVPMLQRTCYSHWTNGARNGVISIGQWGVFNHEKGAI